MNNIRVDPPGIRRRAFNRINRVRSVSQTKFLDEKERRFKRDRLTDLRAGKNNFANLCRILCVIGRATKKLVAPLADTAADILSFKFNSYRGNRVETNTNSTLRSIQIYCGE